MRIVKMKSIAFIVSLILFQNVYGQNNNCGELSVINLFKIVDDCKSFDKITQKFLEDSTHYNYTKFDDNFYIFLCKNFDSTLYSEAMNIDIGRSVFDSLNCVSLRQQWKLDKYKIANREFKKNLKQIKRKYNYVSKGIYEKVLPKDTDKIYIVELYDGDKIKIRIDLFKNWDLITYTYFY